MVEIHELETVMQRGKFLCVDECTVLTLSRPVSHPKFETEEVVLPCKDVEGRTGLVRVFATHLGEQKALLGHFRDKEITLPDTSVVQFTLQGRSTMLARGHAAPGQSCSQVSV